METLRLVRLLAELRADQSLIVAAVDGRITEMRCAMPECLCPNGPTFFYRRGESFKGRWAPSADRWPIPKRDGGGYTADNVRLSHWYCNHVEGSRIGGASSHKRKATPEGAAAIARQSETQRRHWASAKGRRQRVIQGRSHSEWLHSEQGRAANASGNCMRWNINRGRPCSCGWHQ